MPKGLKFELRLFSLYYLKSIVDGFLFNVNVKNTSHTLF